MGKTLKADIGGARDEFVSEYSVPRISRIPFSFRLGMVEQDRVWDISDCFPTSFLMFCSSFAR